MADEMADIEEDQDAVGLYFELRPNELIDLEVAAAAAIEWSRGIKAAALALDESYDYRVSLIAAEPGSSRWKAKLERTKTAIENSKANQAAERVKAGWEGLPLLLRVGIGLAVVVPVTAVPTIEYWFDSEDFSPKQIEQIRDTVKEAMKSPGVEAQRQSLYTEAQRDRRITAVGGGVPTGPEWTPKQTVPANQFAESAGLFAPQEDSPAERTIYQEIDVVLVTPQLENARRVWVFRQEGISGDIRAEMKDKKFLAALDHSGVKETLRTHIPMRIRLEIKQQQIDGEWRVRRRGRSVVEVISPVVE